MNKIPKVPPTYKENDDPGDENDSPEVEPQPVEVEFSEPQQALPGMPTVLELVIHNAGLEVRKIPSPDGTRTLLRLHTPAIIFTIPTDEGGARQLAGLLLGQDNSPSIIVAGANDIPGLRGR